MDDGHHLWRENGTMHSRYQMPHLPTMSTSLKSTLIPVDNSLAKFQKQTWSVEHIFNKKFKHTLLYKWNSHCYFSYHFINTQYSVWHTVWVLWWNYDPGNLNYFGGSVSHWLQSQLEFQTITLHSKTLLEPRLGISYSQLGTGISFNPNDVQFCCSWLSFNRFPWQHWTRFVCQHFG